MDIIPVIDLLQGQVVHARRGERDRYRPIVSDLCGSSEIDQVVQGLLGLYPFKKLYIADLDAITGRGDHASQIAGLRQQHPELEIWLDGGFDDAAQLLPWEASGVRCVIGTERLNSIEQFSELDAAFGAAPILSLDFRGNGFLGPAGLLRDYSLWPEQVICMNLARVGSDKGPDIQQLTALQTQSPASHWYAAGGIRGHEDLLQLQSMNMAGALVATALHDSRISGEMIASLAWQPQKKQTPGPARGCC